jgi:erythromycin esterase-like protein
MCNRDDSNQPETDPIAELERLAEKVWPEEEDVDDFLAWLYDFRRRRREGTPE